MPYKIDRTVYSSQFGTYQSYLTYVIPIVISGSIPNGFYNQYQAVFTFTADLARGHVSIQRPDTGLKAIFTNGARIQNVSPTYEIYRFASSEVVQTLTSYDSQGRLFVNLIILNNTGGTLNLISQTLNIIVDIYDAPVANIR